MEDSRLLAAAVAAERVRGGAAGSLHALMLQCCRSRLLPLHVLLLLLALLECRLCFPAPLLCHGGLPLLLCTS
jgi:hypothetical protein